MVSVGSFATSMTNGSTPSRKKPNYWEGGSIPWVKTGEVNNNLLFKTNEHITELALAETSVHLLPKNTVIMALYGSGTAGRLAILQEKATTNQACTAMVCRTPSQAFYLFLTLQGMYREIDSKTRGSVQQNLSKDIVASLMIPAVTEDLLNEIRLCDIYDQVRANEYESLQLASLRDVLLPKLMSGEIDVSRIDLTQLNSHLVFLDDANVWVGVDVMGMHCPGLMGAVNERTRQEGCGGLCVRLSQTDGVRRTQRSLPRVARSERRGLRCRWRRGGVCCPESTGVREYSGRGARSPRCATLFRLS